MKFPNYSLRHLPLLCLVLAFLSFMQTRAQDKSQVKEPPIPVVIGSNGNGRQFADEESITLSVSDFNHIMEREDSLRRAFSEQTAALKSSSERKTDSVYVLLLLLLLSNSITFVASRRLSSRTRT